MTALTQEWAVGRVREYYSLVDDGDIGGLIELFAPDAVYHRPGYEPMQGRADLERFYRTQRVIRKAVTRSPRSSSPAPTWRCAVSSAAY